MTTSIERRVAALEQQAEAPNVLECELAALNRKVMGDEAYEASLEADRLRWGSTPRPRHRTLAEVLTDLDKKLALEAEQGTTEPARVPMN